MRFPSLTISRRPATPWPPGAPATPIALPDVEEPPGLRVHASFPEATPGLRFGFCRAGRGSMPCPGITLHWSGARAHGLPGRRSAVAGPGPAMASGNYFPPPGQSARLCIAKQNSRPPPSSAALRPCRQAGAGAGRVRPRQEDRREGRDGRGQTSNRSLP